MLYCGRGSAGKTRKEEVKIWKVFGKERDFLLTYREGVLCGPELAQTIQESLPSGSNWVVMVTETTSVITTSHEIILVPMMDLLFA